MTPYCISNTGADFSCHLHLFLLEKKPTPYLPENSEGQRNLECYSPWGCKESDVTQQLNNNNNILSPLNVGKGRLIQAQWKITSFSDEVDNFIK